MQPKPLISIPQWSYSNPDSATLAWFIVIQDMNCLECGNFIAINCIIALAIAMGLQAIIQNTI
jgi:hypothetical protein